MTAETERGDGLAALRALAPAAMLCRVVDLKNVFDDAPGEDENPTQFGLGKVGGAPSEHRLRLVVVNETFLNTYLLPKSGTLKIGRSSDANVHVPHPSVSRQHAFLHLGANLLLEDVGSSNGTAINNVRLAPKLPVSVAAGDVIRLGSVYMHLQREWEEAAPETAKPPQPSARDCSGEVTLVVRDVPKDTPGFACKRTSLDFAVKGRPIVVKSPAMERVFSVVARIAKRDAGVLILGETGAGKEIVAHAIHARSMRREAPFLPLNCAALAEPLLESELFGHEKGAFTGAHEAKPGLLEKARGGTVFLDEIGDMSLAVQAKLLRVLEDGYVLRLGSLEPRAIDVRFIAATNKNLTEEVATGRFRKDCYFRLTTVTIQIPPLRERTAEIEPLATLFLQAAASKAQLTRAPELASETIDVLLRHPWPGNVRELKHVIEHAVFVGDARVIRPGHLMLNGAETLIHSPPRSQTSEVETKKFPPREEDPSIQEELQSVERERLAKALEKHGGNQTRAAEALGIPRRTLVRKLRIHGLQRKSDERSPPSH